MAIYTDGVITFPGQEPVWNMTPGRAIALKLQSGQTGESIMVFEEVAPLAPPRRSISTIPATR